MGLEFCGLKVLTMVNIFLSFLIIFSQLHLLTLSLLKIEVHNYFLI